MKDENKTKKQLITELVELRRRMTQLEGSVSKYTLLIENSPDIVYVLDPKGHFVFVGGAIWRLLGFKPEELTGKHFTSIVLPEDVKKAKWRFNERRTVRRSAMEYEIRLTRKKETWKHFNIKYLPVSLSAFGIYDKSVSTKEEKFIGTYGVARDITRRKQVEESLKEAHKKLLKERDQRINLAVELLKLLEKDRYQIASELHDVLAQNLSAIKNQMEMIRDQLKVASPQLESLIKDVTDQAAQLIRDIKDLSHSLRPDTLESLGLVPSLRSLFDGIKKSVGIEIYFFTKGVSRRLDPEKELCLYRIAQEALNNIIKHAGAKKVFINLVTEGKAISLSVEDDGIGFEMERIMKGRRGKGPLGLRIMKERAVQLGGKLTIESRIGEGTLLMVDLPL